MTPAAITMPFPAGEHSIRNTEVLANKPSASSAADAEAIRIAAGVARGDEKTFRELYDRYHGRIFRLAVSLTCGDEVVAGEVVQSVMLTAAAKLKAVSGENHLWNWLAQVARQKLAKHRRGKGRDAMEVSVAEIPETAESASDPILEERLDAAMLGLEESDRQLLELFYFEGQSQKQLAERLGTTPKAISSRLERARSQLRESLKRRSQYDT